MGSLPLGGKCGPAQVWWHLGKKLQILSSIDQGKIGFIWHVSVSKIDFLPTGVPIPQAPGKGEVELVKVDFGLEGAEEAPVGKGTALHLYMPVGDLDTLQ